MKALPTAWILVGALAEGGSLTVARMLSCSRAIRFLWTTVCALGLLVIVGACASPPPNSYVQPELPEEELAILDWGGSVWGGGRAPDVTAIDGQPVAVQLLGSSTKLTPGKHTISFEYSIYRGLYASPAHSYVNRTLTFTAEAGHRYRLNTDCETLGSSVCSSWVEDKFAEIVVAGNLPKWADHRDLAARSYEAARARERKTLFQEHLASVCAGDRPASEIALYFLAGIAPLGQSELATAYAWYNFGASRGDAEASAILESIERDLSPVQLTLAIDAAAAPLATLCPEGLNAELGEHVPSEEAAEGM